MIDGGQNGETFIVAINGSADFRAFDLEFRRVSQMEGCRVEMETREK
jgi:hypothetical protein